jgi:hypothetical protein
MQTFTETEKNRLIRKFHALMSKAGIGQAGKEGILAGYGVESTRDLTPVQLIEICAAIDLQMNPQLEEIDKARKRLMAAIGGWLRAMGRAENTKIITGIACRASGKERFNDIPMEKLRSLYSAFTKKKKDLAFVEKMTADSLEELTVKN